MRVVENDLRAVRGVGKLRRYDSALGIAAWKRVMPPKVYLHASTRQGGEAIGLNTTQYAVETAELAAQFCRLNPFEIEDCLCVYNSVVTRVPRTKTVSYYRKYAVSSTR